MAHYVDGELVDPATELVWANNDDTDLNDTFFSVPESEAKRLLRSGRARRPNETDMFRRDQKLLGEAPPKSGKGSGVDAWREFYLKKYKTDAPEGATREEIIEMVESGNPANQPNTEGNPAAESAENVDVKTSKELLDSIGPAADVNEAEAEAAAEESTKDE